MHNALSYPCPCHNQHAHTHTHTHTCMHTNNQADQQPHLEDAAKDAGNELPEVVGPGHDKLIEQESCHVPFQLVSHHLKITPRSHFVRY